MVADPRARAAPPREPCAAGSGCRRAGAWYPVLELADSTGRVIARAVVGLPHCGACRARRRGAGDLLSDAGWTQLLAWSVAAGYGAPVRDLTGLRWARA